MDHTREPKFDPDSFTRLATEFVSTFPGNTLSYDERAILMLDSLFTDSDAIGKYSDEEKYRILLFVGSFLGECLAKVFSGRWVYQDVSERWGIEVIAKSNETAFLNPFYKIEKMLDLEEEAGAIEYWYNITKTII